MSSDNHPRIALFLGAGASKPFGKPTTKELKDELLKEYEELEKEIRRDYDGKSYNPRVEDLWYSILLQSILSFDKFEDIEHVLQALKEIDDFFIKSQYGGRYIQSLIKDKYADKYSPAGQDWKFSEYVKTLTEQRRKIENNIFEHYKWKHSKVEKLVQKIYYQLFEEILKHSNSNDIRIFTTNYDKAIEEYCDSEQKRNYHCIDGFRYIRGWSGGRKWDKGKYEPQLADGETPVYLYKLHGSLDWKRHKKHGIVATGEEGISNDSNYIEPMLVYPTLSPKEGRGRDPYRTIRKKFKEELLAKTDVCIVIGFSFRDEHISLIFTLFLKHIGKTLILLSKSAEENIDKNLLRKYRLPHAKVTSRKDDENITIYDVNGSSIIAIKDNMTVKDAEKIVRQKIGPFLSSQTGRRVP